MKQPRIPYLLGPYLLGSRGTRRHSPPDRAFRSRDTGRAGLAGAHLYKSPSQRGESVLHCLGKDRALMLHNGTGQWLMPTATAPSDRQTYCSSFSPVEESRIPHSSVSSIHQQLVIGRLMSCLASSGSLKGPSESWASPLSSSSLSEYGSLPRG